MGDNNKRAIVHLDLDTFFVSVERLLDSRLNNKPVMVGGVTDRGVVASCSYEARAFGIHSGMAMKIARRLCPEGMVVKGDSGKYSKYSAMVTEILKENVPLLEKASVDEFYVDMTGMDKVFGIAQYTAELRQKIIRETGLPISMGQSENKTVSKVATGESKPNGKMFVQYGHEKDFLAPLPVRRLPMVGGETTKVLHELGIKTIHTLQQMPKPALEKVLGKNGHTIWMRAQGIDNTPVKPYFEQESLSMERTFDKDTIDVIKLKNILRAMAEGLAFQLRLGNKLTACIGVKVRYSDMQTYSRQERIPYTSCDHIIIAKVLELFQKLFERRQLIRTIGIKCSNLVGGGHQINLLEDSVELIQLYQEMDYLRKKYKDSRIVTRASILDQENIGVWNPWTGERPTPQPIGTPKISKGMYLNCHSYYSFNYGVMSVEDLLRYSHAMGATHLALTDINNTSGCLDFLRLAPNYGIQPIIGIDFRNGNTQLYIGIALSNLGFRHLNEYLSKYKMAKQELPLVAPVLEGVVFIYPWVRGMKTALLEGHYIGVKPHELTHFRLYGKKHPPGKVVILNTVSFRHKTDFNTHRLLCAIGNNALLSKLEPTLHGTETDVLIPQAKLLALYTEVPQAANNTLTITETAQVYFEFGKSKNKKTYLGNEADDYALLAKLAKDGLDYRYPQQTDKVKQRLAHELETIGKLGFTPYFLINWDMVRFATSQGFFHVGRGSGANSLVAYCMGITDVDPMELDLYFERFINPSRKNPPDFDIDFSHTDRDTVRRYLFDKYPGHTALVGAYSTFEHKAAIREIGKVFGLPPHEIDQLQADRKTASPQQDQYGKLIMHYAAHIHGLPNLLTVHACGVLISEEPITCYSALELPPVGFPVTQYSMLEAEDVGLYKYDVLSQRGLGHIKDAVGFIKTNQGIDIDIHDIKAFKEDLRIKQMLKTGDTIGCFYVESPAMRQLMRKLMVDDYLGLVAASSVIRPGVSSSGMMRQYILRYRYPDKRKEAHPKLLEIMPETFGVMVYQEDVIKVAHYYAGLSLEESDVMRRGMSGKFRSRAEFQRVEDKFFENCQERGYPEEEAKEIWRQVESFAGYSFAKGHSASFAVESYQSLYLRAYYPIEFITAVVNNFGGFYSTEHYLHEARMLGATVELPCVNNSDDLCVLRGTTIYMALCLIKDLERGTVKALLAERQRNGPYISLQDFITRVSISLEQLRILIRIKAFRFTGKSSKELLWEAHMALSKTKKTDPKPELFKAKPEPTQLPELEYGQNEDAFDEMQILGFPFASPFNLMKKQYKGLVMADELMEHLGNVVYIVGYFVTLKPVVTITNQRMFFGSFIDHQGKLFDTVHFPQSVARNSTPSKGCYLLKGTVIEDFDVPSIEVSHMERIAWAID